MQKPLLETLSGRPSKSPPLWLMRQAGRYLPEYREIRQRAGGFLDLVYNPALASDVTLQPVRRFGMDGAILFSDILVIPHALGQNVTFESGEGPRLEPVRSLAALARLNQKNFTGRLAPVLETLRQCRTKLETEKRSSTTLIGFSGAPWTLACYMVEGETSRDYTQTKNWAYRDPEGFGSLISLLTEAVTTYLCNQIESGAEALQIFDSWAGLLDPARFRQWVIEPTRQIVSAVRERHPATPIIGFPRNAGALLPDYAQGTGITALSLDSQTPPDWALRNLPEHLVLQGGLDPVCLLCGGPVLQESTAHILRQFSGRPFIFNLGHGILKETPVEHVQDLVAQVRAWVK